MDVRGHGESSTEWSDFSVASVGSDILALARDLNSGPALLVGDSMAGGAAVWAAAEAPDAFAGLVLIDPFVRDFPGFMNQLYPIVFADPWGAALWLRYYATLYPTRPPADFDSYREGLHQNMREPGRLNALRQMLMASKAASEERLSRVTAPTLVIMGSRDPDFKDPVAEARLVAERVHGQVHMVDGAGHYPHAEMPEVTGPIILAFLQTVREPAQHGA